MAFSFKQFSIDDEGCTMKVGTDAVLLGAIADCQSVKSILDIGTGSGIISLMLAQRSKAAIDGVEIDKDSYLKARQNFRKSPWAERLTAIHDSFQDYCKKANTTYDLIVSNPPFFSKSFMPGSEEKRISRHDESLNFSDLVSGAEKLLAISGQMVLILPFLEKNRMINIAGKHNLHLFSCLEIYPKADKIPNRVILQFRREEPRNVEIKPFVLRNPDNSYSKSYLQITKDFHPFLK